MLLNWDPFASPQKSTATGGGGSIVRQLFGDVPDSVPPLSGSTGSGSLLDRVARSRKPSVHPGFVDPTDEIAAAVTGVINAAGQGAYNVADSVAGGIRGIANAQSNWIEARTSGYGGPVGNFVAGAGAFYANFNRSVGNMLGTNPFDIPFAIEADVKEAIKVGQKHGIRVGVGQFVGTNGFAEAYVGNDLSGRPIDRTQKIAEASGKLGGTFLTVTGMVGKRPRVASNKGVRPSGFEPHGVNPLPETRVRPAGVPEGWRIRPTRTKGGTEYYNPANRNESVRVMQGNPRSQYPNSQGPYVRNRDSSGSFLDANGNRGPSRSPDTHIPLEDFRFNQ